VRYDAKILRNRADCDLGDRRLGATQRPGAISIPPSSPTGTPHPRHAAGWVGETGEASYYSNFYHGRRAANGSRFDQRLLTAAHAWLPFGTKVRVTSASTGESVVVTVTDRIYSARRVIDLSVAAARKLGIMQSGIAEVSLAPV
jgi:rare lipoprotein A